MYKPSEYTDAINELNPQRLVNYRQLTFKYEFEYPNDEVYCAYSIPYTYSAL